MNVSKDCWSPVSSAESLPGHRLLLAFRDGTRGTYEMSPLLRWDCYAPLRDEAFFSKVRVVAGTCSWPGGIDIAPEELYCNCVRG